MVRPANPTRDLRLASREALKRAARTPVGLTGLMLLVIGVLAAVAAGLIIGILVVGNPSNRTALKWLLLSLGLVATAAAVTGNHLWYRARITTRATT